MNSILITGITGYFGALLVPWLKDFQSDVYYLVRGGWERFWQKYNFQRSGDSVIDFDLVNASAEDVITALERIGACPKKIVHLAANVKFGEEEREITLKTNFGGTQKMIQIARHFGAELIFFSTYYVHGAWPDGEIFKEDFAYREPKNSYEESKQKCEIAIRDSGLPYKIIRPSILADCLDSGYCGLLRYFWVIRQYYSKQAERPENGVSFDGEFINLPLEGDFYRQSAALNIIIGDWVKAVLPDIIMAKTTKVIVHLINENPPICETCFSDAFRNLKINVFDAGGTKYSHNLMLKQMVLRVFSYYLSSAPLVDCSNLKKILGEKYRPHPAGDELKAILAITLRQAIAKAFGFLPKDIKKLERILSI